MSLPLIITDEEHIPIYLQIAHQMRYLITNRQLETNAQLPSVRSLAETLGVNAGTVAQAYRLLQQEGLIDSRRGHGSFVMPLADESLQLSKRQSLLASAVDALITRAFALGFDPSTLKQQLSMQLQQRVRSMALVLVAPTLETAEKYAILINKVLANTVIATVTPCSIDHFEKGGAWLRAAYEQAYFTVTFMSLVPQVEAALRKHDLSSEVVGLTANVTTKTVEQLRKLEVNGAYVLAAEGRNVNSALSIIAQHSPVDLRTIAVLTELSSDSEWKRLAERQVIHTFGMTTLLDKHQVPKEQRIELAFTLSDDAYFRLNRLVQNQTTLANV